jgi:Xaa-Pro aminopeptidase
MRSDLDRLMADRNLEALFIVGGGHIPNAPRTYLANGINVNGLVVKKRGDVPIVISHPMEIEEDRHCGLTCLSLQDFGWAELVQQAEGKRTKAEIALWGRILERLAIPPGKIGVYGVGEIHLYTEFLKLVSQAYPDNQFVGEMGTTLFDAAYATKDEFEIARIRSVAERTNNVVAATWDFIAQHRADGEETVVKDDGSALTIGDIKRFVRRSLLDLDLEDTDMIFAQGRDGGFPHSRGEADMALKLGQAIVFDIFPRELGGGYHHDMTRTWSIGYATDEVQEVYNTVMEAFDISVEMTRAGQPTYRPQEAVLDYFEREGHTTVRTQPGNNEGYTHSLGHGLGLNIHERPSLHHVLREDIFQRGNVITIEPGLYYPSRGFGVRIEDTFYIDDNGQLVDLTTFHKELVLPLHSKD